eukprot:COSAG05_NODE_33_length_28089_cov_31.909289_26_plen_173_part_00
MKKGARRVKTPGMPARDGDAPEPETESGGMSSSDDEGRGGGSRRSNASSTGSDSGSDSGGHPAGDDEDQDFSIVEQYVPGVGTLQLPGIESKQQKTATGGRRNDKPVLCFAQLPTAAEVLVRCPPTPRRVDRRATALTLWRMVYARVYVGGSDRLQEGESRSSARTVDLQIR